MLRKTIPWLMLAALAPIAGASEAQPFVARGSYTAGDPLAYAIIDACGSGIQDGIDSSCVALPGDVAGRRYFLEAHDASGVMLAASACFYSHDRMMNVCDPGNHRVPSWAGYVSVSTFGGVDVQWLFVADA